MPSLTDAVRPAPPRAHAPRRRGPDARRGEALDRYLPAGRAGALPGHPGPHALQQQHRLPGAGRRLLRPARLRLRDPGRARALRLGGRVGAVRPRGPGWLRRAGVVRDAALVERQGRHQRRVVPGADPVARGAPPQPAPGGDGAPGGLLEPLPQLGLHGRRVPAGFQPPVGRRPDEHAHEPDAVSLDAARAALLDALLASPAPHGRRARGAASRSSTGSGSATPTTAPTGSASATSRRTTGGSTSRSTGSAGGTTSFSRAP